MKHIITIAREYGSGGREIGEKLAEKLGIKFYDKELITLAAQQSGLCEEVMQNNDEKPVSSLLFSFVMGGRFGAEQPLNHRIFMAQFEVIQQLAQKESCVIVGRCGDYALRERTDTTTVFVHAPMDARIERVVREYGVSADKARETVLKTDRERSAYVNYYSDHKWGESEAYDLCLNSGKLGVAGAVDVISAFIKARESAELL